MMAFKLEGYPLEDYIETPEGKGQYVRGNETIEEWRRFE